MTTETVEEQKRKDTISACLIVKNEEELLPDCLSSIKDLVDEMIVVDTGSTDKTIEIAKSWGAKVYEHPWQNDFAFHRNQSIDYATSEWIFIIDADERFDAGNIWELKELLKHTDFDSIVLQVNNLYPWMKGNDPGGRLPSRRIFRKSRGIKYLGRIHNYQTCLGRLMTYATNFKIFHLGYGMSPEKMKIKHERERMLLKMGLEEEPNSYKMHYEMARNLIGDEYNKFVKENTAEAIGHDLKVLELTNPTDEGQWNIRVMALSQLAIIYFNLENYDMAIKYGEETYQLHPDFLDPMYIIATSYMMKCMYGKARLWYHRYLETQANYGKEMRTDAVISILYANRKNALLNLSIISEKIGDINKASDYTAALMEEINLEKNDHKN